MTKSIRNGGEIFIFAIFLCLAGLLAFNGNYSAEVLNGVKLWVAIVLPSLFPYFFITAILSSLNITSSLALKLSPVTKKLFNTGGITAYAFLMSVISGYPIGAKIVSDLKDKGLISQTESVRASALCSTSSPMFLMGSVGKLTFNSTAFGLLLFITHFISALIVGILFSFYKRKEKGTESLTYSPEQTDNILYESVYSAVNSVLFVGGLITIFYLFTEILLSLKILSPLIAVLTKIFGNENLARGITFGLFECTKGLKNIAISNISIITLPICASLCGFGGLSVICQSLAYLKKAKIKTAPFIIAKIISATVNFIAGLILSLIFFSAI